VRINLTTVFRCDVRKGERVIFLQQYRNESEIKNSSIREKQEDFIYASDQSRKIAEKLLATGNYRVSYEQSKPSFNEKSYDGKEVFRVYINDKSLPCDVGYFIAEFTKEFQEQYGK